MNKMDEDHAARPYQEELLELAIKENVIIYLPTGSGKTFIAIMAMRHFSKDLEGSIKSGAKRTVYVCNTIALAKQQCDVIKNQTNLKCAVYTGDLNVDNWKRDKWEIEFDEHQVIVATCQIIVDVVRHGFMKITNFNLLIFDEAHNAKGGHAMHQLMSLFQHAPSNQLPRVIGLTGILIVSPSKNTVIKELLDLEAIFRSKIATVSNIEEFKNVLIYSTKPQEIFLKYNDIQGQIPIISQRIELLINECLEKVSNWKSDETHFKLTKNLGSVREFNPLKKLKNLLKDFLYQMKDFGIYGTSIAILSVIIELELKKRAAETISMRNMYRCCISYADRIRHILMENLNEQEETESDLILFNSSTKVQALLSYMKRVFATKKASDITCLVFVERRMTAKNLYHIINRYVTHNDDIPIRAQFMVGRNNILSESITTILDDKWNKHVLQSFKRQECNLIVASSVLEEGIDVQSCNHVIAFDLIKSFRSYVQTKGRARQLESVYALLAPETKRTAILKQIMEYREMDAQLKEFLIGKTIDRKAPLIEQINEQFQIIIPPFVTPIGARLEADSAIQLLNRYCMGLPSDSFTVPKVVWSKEEFVTPGKYTKIMVKARLPLQSTIKEDICSDLMSSSNWAKKSAAFIACKQLFLNGELNNNLLPVLAHHIVNDVKPLYFKHWEEFATDNPRTAGTKKNRRVYNIEYPPQLVSAMPHPEATFLLYTITVIPEFERNDDNRHVVDLLATPSQYAIATTKPLPKLAGMPLFMTYGKVRAKIAHEPISIKLATKEELTLLRKFHVMLFRDILRVWKTFFACDYRNEENSFLIVPTIDGVKIDWDLVRNFQNLPQARELSEVQRARIKYVAKDFENRIINTWYSVDDTVRYVVVKVRQDLKALSPFPNNVYPTFASYAEEKYKVKVIQGDQFLLEVKPLTARMNFLSPGGGEGGGKKKIRKLDDILLIPELCHNFRFPGDMWQKASFIPTILHRMHYLLLAEQLRVAISSYLGYEFPNYTPKDLIFDSALDRLKEKKKPEKYVQAPVFPNPRETEAKPVKEINTLVDNTMYKWKEYEEPCDITRYMDKVFKIEVDYFHQFITNKLSTMRIKDNVNNEVVVISNRPAICDVPNDEQLRIDILQITDAAASPEQGDLLSAITAASSNDVFDMERMELLGDSFLKFSISLYLLHQHPTWNEGNLSSVKGQFVSNKNLLYHAINIKLPGALKVSSFNPRDDWQPPLISVPSNVKEILLRDFITPTVLWELKLDDDEVESGKCKSETLTDFRGRFPETSPDTESDLIIYNDRKIVSDKTCADSMEAIIGVCVKNFGIQKTFSVLSFLNICSKEQNLSTLLDINLGNPRLRTNITDKEVNAFLLNCEDLEKNLGYKFNDRAYLLQALTHPSYPTNRLTGCYQQLEFLGDAILDFLISSYIFERCKHMDPGKLTDLRSALVNNVTLACMTVRNKVHLFMLYQNAALSQAISKFVNFQETQDHKVTDQCRLLVDESNVSSSMSSSLADYVDVPKALGDIFEALIGAIFLDSKNDLKKTWAFIYRIMSQEIHEFMRDVPIQIVRKLYEYHGAGPVFSDGIVDDDVVMVKCKFTCRSEIREVCGFGKNTEQARISSAKLALQLLHQS